MKRTPYLIAGITVFLLVGTLWLVGTGRGGCLAEWTPAGSEAARECDAMRATQDVGAPWEKLTIVILGSGFAFLGAFLLRKAQGNRFGLIFCVQGLAYLLTGFAEVYTVHGLVESDLPGASAAAVVAEIVGGPLVFIPFAFFFLLFPTGKIPGPRWRPVVWAAVASGAALLITSTFGISRLRLARFHEHPLNLAFVTEVREVVETVGMLVFLVALLASIVSLTIRFRRARGVERQQIRWFAAAASFVALVLICAPIMWSTPALEPLWGPLFVTSVSSLPIAATIAILRYRLYDIDVFVNRALVYTTLSAALATFYVGFVFALQNLLPLRADSDLAVAGSTLAAAALFRPLRKRIQTFIDHRFYRRRYDATQALADLKSRLRDEIDLGNLKNDIEEVVRDTLQPAHASLWVKGAAR